MGKRDRNRRAIGDLAREIGAHLKMRPTNQRGVAQLKLRPTNQRGVAQLKLRPTTVGSGASEDAPYFCDVIGWKICGIS